MRKRCRVGSNKNIDGHPARVRSDDRHITVIRDDRVFASGARAIVAIIPTPWHTLLTAPPQILPPRRMRRRFHMRTQTRDKTANTAGIDFRPDHWPERIAGDRRHEIKCLRIGGCIDQEVTCCEFVESRCGATRWFLAAQCDPPDAYL